MQISFDPRDPNATASVLVALSAFYPSAMQGDEFADLLDTVRATDTAALTGFTAIPTISDLIRSGDLPDPATAFAGGTSAEQAFAPVPPVAGAAPPVSPVAATGDATPPTPPAAASPPPSGVELDKEGLPWDNRIHSTPAKINKSDGLWRAKKNLDDAERTRVVAELRQAMGAPVPTPAAPASDGAPSASAPVATDPTTAPPAPVPTPPAAPTASGQAVATPAPSHDPLAAAIADNWTPHPTSAGWYYRDQDVCGEAELMARYPAPVADTPAPPPPPPAPAAAGAVTDFASLMRKITGAQTAGTLTVERTKQISESLGIAGVRDLMHRPDLIPAFDAAIG